MDFFFDTDHFIATLSKHVRIVSQCAAPIEIYSDSFIARIPTEERGSMRLCSSLLDAMVAAARAGRAWLSVAACVSAGRRRCTR